MYYLAKGDLRKIVNNKSEDCRCATNPSEMKREAEILQRQTIMKHPQHDTLQSAEHRKLRTTYFANGHHPPGYSPARARYLCNNSCPKSPHYRDAVISQESLYIHVPNIPRTSSVSRMMGTAESERNTFNARCKPDGSPSHVSVACSPMRKSVLKSTDMHCGPVLRTDVQHYHVRLDKGEVEMNIENDSESNTADLQLKKECQFEPSQPRETWSSSDLDREEKGPNTRVLQKPEPIENSQSNFDWFDDTTGSYTDDAYDSSTPDRMDSSASNTKNGFVGTQTYRSHSDYGGAYSPLRTAASTKYPFKKGNPLTCVGSKTWQERFMQRYERVTVPYIDTHCHIDLLYERSKFIGTYDKFRRLNKDTFPANYKGCIAIFCRPCTFDKSGKSCLAFV